MEFLDIVDENGIPTGETVERAYAHLNGVRHRTSHVWLVRLHGGTLQVLLQKRSDDKDSFPGCWDISSAGHIPAGVSWIPSALRELREELGMTASPEALCFLEQHNVFCDTVMHGHPFRDNQVSRVYLLRCSLPESAFVPQKEEISEVRWFDFEPLLRDVAEGRITNCIVQRELRAVYERASAPDFFSEGSQT